MEIIEEKLLYIQDTWDKHTYRMQKVLWADDL